MKIILVGVGSREHVGAHFRDAAESLGLETCFRDAREAFIAPRFVARFNWWLRGHRPSRLKAFSRDLVNLCRSARPAQLLTTGLAPIDAEALREIGTLGVRRLNFLTDDPWNPAHRAPWFMEGLPLYDHVFSPRKANLDDLRGAGGAQVSWLPFAYAPSIHFPDPPTTAEERVRYDCDVVFAGGADEERVATMVPLIQSGVRVALYGGYWDRYAATRTCARGMADLSVLRRAMGGARVALGLVRRANRDGHCMRTFEVPASGGCLLAQDTEEHRDIFGPEGDAVLYFSSRSEMIGKVQRLLADDDERRRLAKRAFEVVTRGRHTYADRLTSILDTVSQEVARHP